MSLLTIDRLTKRFADLTILDGVSLDLKDGECVALLGPSGCGKTTMLRCVAGLEQPSSGEIRLAGHVLNGDGVALPPQERGLGMVFQSYSVWPHLTVAENVAYGLKLRGVPKAEREQRVAQILKMMAIEHLARRRSWQLSGGQLQRVALARTLVVEPKLVLFDEPLSNLDAQLRLQMRVEIRTLLKRAGLSAIYVTHDQSEASVVADRTAVMNRGQIEQIGTWEQLYHRPATRFVAEFMSNGNVLKGVVESARDDAASARLSGGLGVVNVALPHGCARPSVGQAIEVYCPREAVKLTAPHDGEPAARVQTVLPGAGVFEIVLALPDETSMTAVVLADRDPPRLEETYVLRLDASRLSLLAQSPL